MNQKPDPPADRKAVREDAERSGTADDLFRTDGVRRTLKKRSVRGGAITAGGSAANFLLRFGSIAILARLLVPEDFGLVAMVAALVAVAETIKDLGLSVATIQRKEITHAEVTNLFWINTAAGAAITLVVCLASPLIAAFYHDPRVIPVAAAISLRFLCAGLTVQHQALLTRQMKFARLIGIQFASTLFSVAFTILLAVLGYRYWALVWGQVCAGFVSLVATWLSCPWTPGWIQRGAKVGSLIRFGSHITGFNLVYSLTANLDQILIGRFLGAGLLGFYRQAYNLIMTPIDQLSTPFHKVGQPALSAVQGEKDSYRRSYRKMLTAQSFVVVPLMLFVFVYAKEITLVALGPQWVASIPIVRILSLAAFPRPAMATAGLVMLTCGLSRRYFWLGTIECAVMVILIAVGVGWGTIGVAYGQLAATCVLLVPSLWFAFKGTPVSMRIFVQGVQKPLIAAGAMVAVLWAMNSSLSGLADFWRLAGGAAVGAAVYILAWIGLPGGKKQLGEMLSDFVGPLVPGGLLVRPQKEKTA